MFYVYDLDGLRFKGPMETLEAERKVDRRQPVSPITPGEPKVQPGPTGGKAIEAYLGAGNKSNLLEPLLHIHQIMSSPVATVHRDVSLLDSWLRLQSEGIRQMVVVSDRNEVVGLLSDRDILQRIKVVDDEVDVERNLVVADVVGEETISTDSMSDIRRVARVMAYYHVDAMPVVRDDGKLVGIVTRGDILRGFAANPKLNLWA